MKLNIVNKLILNVRFLEAGDRGHFPEKLWYPLAGPKQYSPE